MSSFHRGEFNQDEVTSGPTNSTGANRRAVTPVYPIVTDYRVTDGPQYDPPRTARAPLRRYKSVPHPCPVFVSAPGGGAFGGEMTTKPVERIRAALLQVYPDAWVAGRVSDPEMDEIIRFVCDQYDLIRAESADD